MSRQWETIKEYKEIKYEFILGGKLCQDNGKL